MGLRKGAWTTGLLLDAAALHHYRTRSSREQRRITVKAAEADEAAPMPFPQFSGRASRK
ncbi:hypothetical protein TPA0906_50260 [Streptomyces olivaceus]|nr:hypothetical protein TPA0906_50260 [Streptomyces olivaceus]